MVVDGDDGDSTINMSAEISKRWAGLGVQAKEEVNRRAAQLQAETEAVAFEEKGGRGGSSSVESVHYHGSVSLMRGSVTFSIVIFIAIPSFFCFLFACLDFFSGLKSDLIS